MCIFVVVLASVAFIACWRMRKRIKALEAEFEGAERYVAALEEAVLNDVKAKEDRIAELEAALQKTPARGADGRYKSRKA